MMQFDTHKMFKTLKDAGIEDKAADAFVSIVKESRQFDLDNLVTKQDLKLEIANLRAELKEDNANLRAELKEEIAKSMDKIYNLGKFILGVVLIPIGIKLIELFLPKLLQ